MIEEILESAPMKYRDWLDKALEGSNQPSLRARLDETINDLKLGDFIGKNKSELESFVRKVTVTRHYLTHYGKRREREAISPEKLFPYVMRLRLIVLACLLKEVGFGIDEINSLIRKYSETFPPL
jgi:5-methylcytosine-specific restriction endonuclease McrBC regulatory subunit McrC